MERFQGRVRRIGLPAPRLRRQTARCQSGDRERSPDAATKSEFMALRDTADAGARAILPVADSGRPGRKFLRNRRFWRPAAELHACQLRGRAVFGADLSSLSDDVEIHGPDLVL